jgi:hypothetical protein
MYDNVCGLVKVLRWNLSSFLRVHKYRALPVATYSRLSRRVTREERKREGDTRSMFLFSTDYAHYEKNSVLVETENSISGQCCQIHVDLKLNPNLHLYIFQVRLHRYCNA